MKNHFLKYTSILVIITFISLNLASAYPAGTEMIPASTLGVQLVSKPVSDPLKADALKIKTYLLCEYARDNSFFDRDIDLSVLNSLGELRVHFSGTIDATPEKGAGLNATITEKVEITPVTFNDVSFYVCRVMDRNGKEGLEVFSCEHFNPYEKKFDIDRGSGEIKLTSPSAVSCVSAADSAVTNAISFFNALGLEHIALELGRTAEDGRIYITELETEAAYGAIFLSPGLHGPDLAAVLIAAYLKMLDADMLDHDITAIKNVYSSYVSSVSSFSAEEHIEEGLLMTLLSMETSLKNPAANEGGLKLHPSAYSHMIDLSGVSMKDCEDIGVIEDVRKIFTEVVEHFYGMKWVKAYVAQMDGKPDIKVPPHVTKKENLPGKGDRLLIRKISNGLLPSALSLENGTIILNENFLKMLYKIKKDFFIGDQKYDGYLIGGLYDNEVSIFDETDMHTPYLGNFYISLIYSVAYHEIKGHYEINDEGEFIHRRDENKAQAMRGGSKSVYVNVIAVSAYLLGFVEGGIRISGWKIEDFVRENPALFSNVPNSMRVPDRKKNLTCSIYRFFADKAGLGDLLSFFNKSKRIPIPFYSDLTFTELYDYVSRNPSKDLYVIAEEAGEGDAIEVAKKLEFLQRSGVLLKVERARDGKPLSIPVYVLTNAAKKNFDAVRQELSSIPKFLKAEKFDEYFEKLKAITAVDKMPVIDTQDKSVSKKDEERSKPEEKTHLTWQDVVSVFDFICLQEEYEPITVAELSYFLNTGEGQNDISDRTVAGSVQVLLTLGLVERKKDKSGDRGTGNVAVLAYSLKEEVDYRDIDLLTGIKQLFESEKTDPSKADFTVIRNSLEILVEKSNKDRPQREIAARFWKRAAELVETFARDKKPVTVENCVSEEHDSRETGTLLEVLARTGVLMKTRSRSGEIVYEPRDMDERRQKAVSDIFLSLKTPVSSVDTPGIKEMVMRVLSSRRKWEDVFSTAPVLLWINDVNSVLLSGGLKQEAEYTPEEISDFFDRLGKSYNTAGGGLEALAESLAQKYSLQEEEKIMLRYRMAFLASHGKKKEQWFFNARSIVRWLDGVGEEIIKDRVFTKNVRIIYNKIASFSDNIDKLDIDLFLLSRIGLLDTGDEPCMYSIGTFMNARQFSELVNTRLNGNLLGMPVSRLHEKKVRETLFNKTWPLALFVFSSLRHAPGNTLNGSGLLNNLGSGIDEGARSLFMGILRRMSSIGLIEPFRVPRTVAGFDKLEFKCADMDKDEYRALNEMVDSLGCVDEKSFGRSGSAGSEIFDLLVKNDYVNLFGYTTRKFWTVSKAADLKLESESRGVEGLTRPEKIFIKNREAIYAILRKARKQLLLEDDNYSMLTRRLALEVLKPNLKGAFYVFDRIRNAPVESSKTGKGALPMFTGSEISSLFPELEPGRLAVYLDFLSKTGLLQRSGKNYRAVRMYKDMFGSQLERISRLMDDPSARLDKMDISLFTTRVLQVTEPIWAARFISRDSKKALARVKDLNGEGPGSRILLAFDKSWLPAAQRTAIEGILRDLRSMNNIVVVTSDNPGDLPGMISRAAGSGEDSIPWKNVITFTGDSAVKDKFFMQRYNSLDTEKESFLVGVDESGVGDDKYLRIVEMICMALDQAFQNRMINHPRINVRTLRAEGNSLWSGRRIYIYVPEPELIDINEIPYVYKAQSKVLQSA